MPRTGKQSLFAGALKNHHRNADAWNLKFSDKISLVKIVCISLNDLRLLKLPGLETLVNSGVCGASSRVDERGNAYPKKQPLRQAKSGRVRIHFVPALSSA